MSASTVGGIAGFIQVNSDIVVLGGPGVNDVGVTLTNLNGSPVIDASGNVVAPVLSAQYGPFLEGRFAFTNIPDGTYALELPPDATLASSTNGRFLVTISGTTDQVVLDVTSGFAAPTDDSAAISGTVYADANDDGRQDNGEAAAAGQLIELTNAGQTVVDVTTASSNGSFSFTGLTPGNYTLTTPGIGISQQLTGGTIALTSGETVGNDVIGVSSLAAGGAIDASVSGLIFLDENDDGLFEVTPQGTDPDLGTGGITVGFYNAQGTLAGTVTSQFGGLFSAISLDPGIYTLKDLSAGIISGGPSFQNLTVTSGEVLSTLDIGFYEPNSIVVPSIFIDTKLDGNDDGPADYLTASSAEPVTVALLTQDGSIARDLNGNLEIQTFTSGVLQDTSQQFGPYTVDVPAVTFGDLAPGYYAVQVTAPGYASETSVNAIGASLETAGLPEEPTTAVQPVALYKVGTGLTITGAIYAGNGSSEQGVAGTSVTLLEKSNGTLTVEQSVEVGADGQYSFSGLAAGQTYEIDFGTPLGYGAITPIHDVAVSNTGTAGTVQGPLAFFTLNSAPGTLAASTTLNIVLIGQSNAALFDGNGYLQSLANDIEKDLGFNGVNQVVNLIAAPGPGDSASNNISSAPATEFGGTALTTDWLTAINGNPANGWNSGVNENGVYSEMNAILTYLAQSAASDPALSSEPTVILDLHNETDSQNPALNTSLWMSALEFEASAIRGVLGASPAQVPYEFVNAIPFPEEPIATASQAQVDSNEQAIRLGMESLASDPAFDAQIAAQISDVDQNYQAAGDGGWHLNGAPTVNSAGQTVGVQINPATGTNYDEYNLEQRLALSLADEFASSALAGSPVANAVSTTGTLLDDTGPQVTAAATVAGRPDELLVTVQQFDSLTSFNMSLSADAQAGVGWSIRTSATGASSQLVASATSASIINSSEILLTFDTAVPAAASGDELFYAWGGARIAEPATPSSPLNTDYSGTTYPGEGQAIYDSNGLPIYTNAAGVLVGSSNESVATNLSVALGQTVANPVITGGTLELGVSASVSLDISFSPGTGGALMIDGAPPLAMIAGFAAGDTIELENLTYDAGDMLTWSGSTLTISGNGVVDRLNFSAQKTVLLQAASNGAAELTAACYAAGTMILTPTGATPIQALRAGDLVLAQAPGGAPSAQPVIWTGHRPIDLTRHAQPEAVMPIRIRAGALGGGLPERDLRVSPHHAMFLDGALYEAQALINGTSILRETVRHVTYHHVELAKHSLILAEGCLSETYLDTGNRDMFLEFTTGPVQLHAVFRTADNAPRCAPLVQDGLPAMPGAGRQAA